MKRIFPVNFILLVVLLIVVPCPGSAETTAPPRIGPLDANIESAKQIVSTYSANNGVKNRLLDMGFTEQQYEEFLTYRTLQIGCEGNDVLRLKNRLYELGYYKNNSFNNSFTENTAQYVKELQKVNGLEQTGIVAPELLLFILHSPAITGASVSNSSFTYKEWARSPSQLLGYTIWFDATVVQQIDVEGTPDVFLFLAFNGRDSQPVVAFFANFKNIIWTGTQIERLLRGDRIHIKGEAMGERSYETVDGGTITAPYMEANYINLYQ